MRLIKLINIFRFFLLCAIIYYLLQNTKYGAILAFSLLILSIVIRLIELYILRKGESNNQVHTFLDPIVDKISILALCLFFWINGLFWTWALGAFLLRDLVVNRYRWLSSKYAVVLKKDKFTPLTRISQYTLLLILIFQIILAYYNTPFQVFSWLFITELLIAFIAVIIVILSMFYNIYNYLRGLSEKKKLGKNILAEKLIILANPSARGFMNLYRRRLLKKFSKRRNAPILYLNTSNHDLFKDLVPKIKNYKCIIIAGGDGTFESAVSSKWLKGKTLGFFPLGAGNAFYSYFYRGNKFEYLQSLFNFREIELDVLELSFERKKKETLFFCLGTDAEVLRLSTDRTKTGFWNYFKGGAITAFTVKTSYDLDIFIDKKKSHWDNCINLTLAKIPFYGFGMRSLIGKVDHTDGKVYGLACINNHTPLFNKALRLWSLLLVQLGLGKSPLLPLKGKEFIIKSNKDFPIQAGGDFLGYTKEIKIKVIRTQKVLVI